MELSDFHFIRPYWFFAAIPVVYVLWKLAKQHLVNKHWESVCDPELLPYILVGKSGRKKYTNVILTSIVGLLTIIALAGPTWERLPQPVFQKESALVIALDLSVSMYADDIKPNRLERARFKIADLLKLRKEGQTALLVYAGDAFTVTPLTDDIKTISSQLSALSPAIMPAPGSRTDIAIEKSLALLKQAGITQGHVLLVTDEVQVKYEDDFINAKKQGYAISILGLGTEEGAPVNLGQAGFLEDRTGSIVIAKLNETTLSQLASSAGGYYETSQVTDGDIERLNRLFNSGLESDEEAETDLKTDQWQEFGPWLVLIIIPIVAFGFRRGYLAILVCLLISNPDEAIAFEWNDLWLNKNQQAIRALENEQADTASELFQDKEWKAAAKYKAGDYAAAEELLNQAEDVRSLYNKANAMAKQGRYEEAIETYDEVLNSEPQHDDAKYNKEIVEKELEKQQQQQQSGDNSDNNNDQNEEQNSEQQQQGSDSDNNDQQSDSEQQQSESEQQQSSQQQDKEDQNEESQSQGKSNEQQQADKEKEEKLNQALEQEKQEQAEEQQEQKQQQAQQEIKEIDEQQQAEEQWLRRIPDDPSGLLRRKFKYMYSKEKREISPDEQYW
ncbi:MAG: VWA domain-containing protein [Gammaproteobacteria bacterium]|jgi:Ca-activated chloride channel family protein